MFEDFIRYLTRKKTRVVFNDLTVNRPVSSFFGLDRGTPIDRYYIEKFLASRANLVLGRVLEVGDDTYSRRFGAGKVTSFEVLHATSTARSSTIVGDLTDPSTLPKNAVDCFICTQTFNFIFEVQKAIQGAHALLKPGGVLLATVGGISQISRYDMDRWGDYWRFTTASVEKLFAPVFAGGVEIHTFGNVLAATAFLQGLAVEDLPDPALLDAADGDYQLIIAIVARKSLNHG
ncbi:putative SAM-dependent methyltransferase [Desulfuromonas soudanensis]|uniref:Putative SAM-dependent methyltransferase n=1 Tax=Desulfuromonas soudanensis TaxID=1603606 RepID=A0A0M4CZK4_9BACT|nr:methyltransferase domain-containing protein [Desulfuromonas soudanensis]ALC15484.1 putative SAM-dependent methyltransferase [Desulfuromonas soudanensis]